MQNLQGTTSSTTGATVAELVTGQQLSRHFAALWAHQQSLLDEEFANFVHVIAIVGIQVSDAKLR
jgi:hypothetical protein